MDIFLKSLWDKFRSRKRRLVSSPHSPPWTDWELDPDFFAALSRWTIQHPERSLDRVFQGICEGIDRSIPILALIPDIPFPARSLMVALANLITLGITISTAQKNVQDFAKTIVHWVGEINSALETEKGGRSGSNLRKNLRPMRVLVDEICKWATARLDDGRWRMSHGLSVKKEIDEFRTRIVEARNIFVNVSIIQLRTGQDNMFMTVQQIAIIQNIQKDQLLSFLDAMEDQKKEEAQRHSLSQTLSKRAVANSAYDDQGKRPCDSETRHEILADIMGWVYDTSDDSQRFLWLTGDPGSGKSAVTASITRSCKDAGILWAQFFINRNISTTTNPASYFPSIARQLADRSPEVAQAIHDALMKLPSLMDDISQDQAGKLFVDSLKVASAIDSSKPVLVIIDALDETDPIRLRDTATIFSKALVELPRNAKVFISSRTEDDIRKPFALHLDMNRVKNVYLDTSAESSMQDVSTFLMRRIAEIVEQNGLDEMLWPGEERMALLCKQASGLFIWAVTAVKFIQVQVKRRGSECLDRVLGELNSKGMGDINVLYNTILLLTHEGESDSWIFKRFRQIVGCVVILQEPLCLMDIKSLLNPRNPVSDSPVDIEHYVSQLRTVLVAGTEAIHGETIPRLHKSFVEFITSERADPRFQIDVGTSNKEVGIQCIRQLADWPDERTTPTMDGHPSTVLRYASQHWTLHFTHAECLDANLVELHSMGIIDIDAAYNTILRLAHEDKTEPWMFERFRQIFGCIVALREPLCLGDIQSLLNLPNPTSEAPVNIEHYIGQFRTLLVAGTEPVTHQTVPRLQKSFIKYITSEQTDPHFRVNVDASNRELAVQCLRQLADWSDQYTAMKTVGNFHAQAVLRYSFQFWPSHLAQTCGTMAGVAVVGEHSLLELQESRFSSRERVPPSSTHIAYLPSRKRIILSADNAVQLWDMASDRLLELPLKIHVSDVKYVAVSPDGMRDVSRSIDLAVRLWDVEDYLPICLSLKGHTGSVRSVAFSPDGLKVVSGSYDRTVRIWDVASGEPIGVPLTGHTDWVRSAAFSPDGLKVVSGSDDCTVRLWDVASGQPIGFPLRGHTGWVRSVAFSPDGLKVVSGSDDCTIRLWDVASDKPISFPLKGHTNLVKSVAFSPDGLKVLSGSCDRTVRLWDVASGEPIGFLLNGQTDWVRSVAFSPDGLKVVSGSDDCAVHLWDVTSGEPIVFPLKGHTNLVESVAFSPDGLKVVSGSFDCTVRIWDVASGQPIGFPLENHTDWVRSVAFSPDRLKVVSGSDDCAVLLWDVAGFASASGLWWSPIDVQDFGLLAYIDGKVIRTDSNGLTSITNMSEILRELGIFT